MVIIRDLNENDNMVYPSIREEYIEIWKHCVMDVKWPNKTMGYNLVELGMFGSYNSSSDSNSDSGPLFHVLPWKSRVVNGSQFIQTFESGGF